MPSKYGFLKINAPIDEIWEKNQQYWAINKGKILNSQIYDNRLLMKFEVKSSHSMHIYGYSFGEKYNFQFGYDPSSKVTTIIVQVKFNILGGRGFIWKIPQETINKWTEFMGFESIHLENKRNSNFLAATTLLSQIQEYNQVETNKKYCSNCGVQLNQSENYCQLCGNDLNEELVPN